MSGIMTILSGVALGALTGALIAAASAMLPLVVLRRSDGAGMLGVVILLWGVPTGVIAGGIAGGNIARAGELEGLTRALVLSGGVCAAMFAGAFVRQLIAQRPRRAADGCRVERIDCIFVGNISVLVYERVCPKAPRRTLNLSIFDQSFAGAPDAPGNVLVVDRTDGDPGPDAPIRISAGTTTDVAISLDRRERVLGQHTRAGGVSVEFIIR